VVKRPLAGRFITGFRRPTIKTDQRRAAVTLACPKCASVDARSVVVIYRETLFKAGSRQLQSRTPLARDAVPPRRRNVVGWLLVTLILATAFLFELSSFGMGTIVLGGLALTGVWMTHHIRAYNATDLPDLMKRWERSVMCNRCGHVYTRLQLPP
jgi:hypothetical protein